MVIATAYNNMDSASHGHFAAKADGRHAAWTPPPGRRLRLRRLLPALAASSLLTASIVNGIRPALRIRGGMDDGDGWRASFVDAAAGSRSSVDVISDGPISIKRRRSDGAPPGFGVGGTITSATGTAAGAIRHTADTTPFVVYVNDACNNEDEMARMGFTTGQCIQGQSLVRALVELGVAYRELTPSTKFVDEAIAETKCEEEEEAKRRGGGETKNAVAAALQCRNSSEASALSTELCRDAADVMGGGGHTRPIIVSGARSADVAGWVAGQLSSCPALTEPSGGGDGGFTSTVTASEGKRQIRVQVPPLMRKRGPVRQRPPRVALLSWFGIAPSHAPSHVHVPDGYEILAVAPAEGNAFLGYALHNLAESHGIPASGAGGNASDAYGVVLGKNCQDECAAAGDGERVENFHGTTNEVLQHAAKHLPLMCTGCKTDGITDVGKLPQEEWRELLAKSRLLLGLGDPMAPPSVLEAISLGCVAVLPRDVRAGNKQRVVVNGVDYESQYDHLRELVAGQPSLEPYVCWYATLTDLDMCVSRAAGTVLPRITIDAFTPESFRSRVKEWLNNEHRPYQKMDQRASRLGIAGSPNGTTRNDEPFVYYVNNACNAEWRRTMGYTGECVQHSSLLDGFRHLGIAFETYEPPPGRWDARNVPSADDLTRLLVGTQMT